MTRRARGARRVRYGLPVEFGQLYCRNRRIGGRYRTLPDQAQRPCNFQVEFARHLIGMHRANLAGGGRRIWVICLRRRCMIAASRTDQPADYHLDQ
jgi:hypothetical protein